MQVGLLPAIARGEKIEKERTVRKWLLQLGVDLPGNAFKPIDDASGALGDLNAFDPGAWRKSHAVDLRRSPHRGDVFLGNQYIRTGQAQHFDLLGAGECIGKIDVDGGVGLKTFGEIATSCFEKFGTADRHHVLGL